MDRYQRVEKPRAVETSMTESEIRITSQGRMRNYITCATSLLQEKGSDEISLKAMGRAINKTVMIAELIKRRIVDLHQNTSIRSTDITDTWEPLEEGLVPLETTHHVSVLTITLSKKELDTASAGYQPPIPGDQVKSLVENECEGVEVVVVMETIEGVITITQWSIVVMEAGRVGVDMEGEEVVGEEAEAAIMAGEEVIWAAQCNKISLALMTMEDQGDGLHLDLGVGVAVGMEEEAAEGRSQAGILDPMAQSRQLPEPPFSG